MPSPFLSQANREAAEAASAAHHALLEQLDINNVHKPFRSPTWKPHPRRNKNIKTILGDATRVAASNQVTVDNSGAATPSHEDTAMPIDGEEHNGVSNGTAPPNLAQASQNLSKLVLERNLKAAADGPSSAMSALGATYSNIESAPGLAVQKRYCDITGLKASYTDPKSRLMYHDKEVYGVIQTLGNGVAEQYLEARGAHTVLK